MSKRTAKKKETAIVPEVVEPVLSRRHESVLVALIAHPKVSDAAKAAGVNESTIFRLMQREDFQKRLQEAREKHLDSALSALQSASVLAVATLQRNLTCGTPTAENQAASTLLGFTLKVREQFGLEERLKQLEGALKARDEADKKREAAKA